MILETYLKQNNTNFREMHLILGIPETKVRSINKRKIDNWNIEYFDTVSKNSWQKRFTVIKELEELEINIQNLTHNTEAVPLGRYIGNKSKLLK